MFIKQNVVRNTCTLHTELLTVLLFPFFPFYAAAVLVQSVFVSFANKNLLLIGFVVMRLYLIKCYRDLLYLAFDKSVNVVNFKVCKQAQNTT